MSKKGIELIVTRDNKGGMELCYKLLLDFYNVI